MLLVAYLPLLLGTTIHVHRETSHAADRCVQCAGHFESQHHHQGDCLYCHLLDTDCLGMQEADASPFFAATPCVDPMASAPHAALHHGVAQLRAPPTA